MTQKECLDMLDSFDCGRSEGDIEECKDMIREALMARSIQIETPKGLIRAVKSPDANNPGIILLFEDAEGKEHSSCMMHYMESQKRVVANVFGPDDPDREPVFTFGMN